MSMKFPVPKCKDCNYHKHNSFLRGSHYCTFEATNKEEVMEWMKVPGRDMKTSPQWCPKRKIKSEPNYMNDLLKKYGRNK